MPTLQVLLSEPRSDTFAKRLDWLDTLTLPAAPQTAPSAARPQHTTLLDILKMEEADELFKHLFGFKLASTCRALYALWQADGGFFGFKIYLLDAEGRLSWQRFQSAMRAVAARPGMAVTEIHAMHSEAAADVMWPQRHKLEKLNKMMRWIFDLVETHQKDLKELGLSFGIRTHDAYEIRQCGKSLPGPFPSMLKFSVNNESRFNDEVLTMLRGMPRLTHVCIFGGLELGGSSFGWAGSPDIDYEDVMQSAAAVLPPSVVSIDIGVYTQTIHHSRDQFVFDFVAAVKDGRFRRLKTLRMVKTYATMIKRDGVPFMKSLERCAALCEVVIGDQSRFKSWHVEALQGLRLARPDIRIS